MRERTNAVIVDFVTQKKVGMASYDTLPRKDEMVAIPLGFYRVMSVAHSPSGVAYLLVQDSGIDAPDWMRGG